MTYGDIFGISFPVIIFYGGRKRRKFAVIPFYLINPVVLK